MARPLRLEFPGALYHVTARGNERKPIVRDDSDRELWLQCLERVCSRFGWVVYAYCLMDNHFHFVVETPVPNLARGMRELNGVYAQRFNRRHRRSGHLFGGRYSALLVKRESHLLEVSRYVVLNPERVAVPSERYDRYAWSSYLLRRGWHRLPASSRASVCSSSSRTSGVRPAAATVPSCARASTTGTRSRSCSARSTSATRTSPAGGGAEPLPVRCPGGSANPFATRSKSSFADGATTRLRLPTATATRCESWRPSSACTTPPSAGDWRPRSRRSACAEGVALQDLTFALVSADASPSSCPEIDVDRRR